MAYNIPGKINTTPFSFQTPSYFNGFGNVITNTPNSPVLPKAWNNGDVDVINTNIINAQGAKDERRKKIWEFVKKNGPSAIAAIQAFLQSKKSFGSESSNFQNSNIDSSDLEKIFSGSSNYQGQSSLDFNPEITRSTDPKNPFGINTSTLLILGVGAFLYFSNKKNK